MKNTKPDENGSVYRSSNNNYNNQNNDVSYQLDADTYIIDNLDQKLLELLARGYENKKIAAEVKTPLSTIQRRIRKIFQNQYVSRKNELNYKKLGLRKGYLQISLRGDKSYEVAQKLAGISSIISVAEVTSSFFDILCICIFKTTDELFSLIENIKIIERRIDKVAWVEEVHSLALEEKNLFETLWQTATPAARSIGAIEKGLIPIETKVLDNSGDSINYALYCVNNTDNGLSNCTSIGAFKLVYENKMFYQSYLNLLSKYKEGKIKGGVRWVTHIEDSKEQAELIKKALSLGMKIRHINYPIPLSFGVSEKQFVGTIEEMRNGKMIETLLYSSERLYVRHFQSIFDELWKMGINAQQRIDLIERGVASETTKVIENSSQAIELFLHLIENAREEIMIVIPSSNSVKRQSRIGVIESLIQKGQEGLKVRILSPISDGVKELLQECIERKKPNTENIDVKGIAKYQDINCTILMVDKKHLLAVELKDDSKETLKQAIGLATYSTSKPTLLSYISIFESLWTLAEMFDVLRMANEKLEINDKLQRDFINNAAHELRTPSQAILGYTELALLDYDANNREKNIENLKTILRQAQRVSRLNEKILDVAKIESRTLKINPEPFNFEELISDTIKEFGSNLKKLHKNIEISFEKMERQSVSTRKKQEQNYFKSSSSSPSLSRSFHRVTSPSPDRIADGAFQLYADKNKIEQVMVNLLDNAIKFSKEKIVVRLVKDNSQVVVEVIDSGLGIADEIMPNIFSKFVSKSHTGICLGLFISKSIIEAHGGKIWVFNNKNNNKDGVGATFAFSLPITYKSG
jgi:signal transduction histidine kinase/DNA-binding Lrp family transcriptional regulator